MYFPEWEKGLSKQDFPDWMKVCDKFSWIFSYSIPTDEAINEMKKYSPIIEMGAGLGYWAWILRNENCVIESFDNKSYFNKIIENNSYSLKSISNPEYWIEVKDGNPDILKTNYENYTLFLSWPISEKEGEMASDCLKYYSGNNLLYVGELEGGHTGGELFLSLLNSEWLLKRKIRLPSWPGYDDNFYIYEKKINRT